MNFLCFFEGVKGKLKTQVRRFSSKSFGGIFMFFDESQHLPAVLFYQKITHFHKKNPSTLLPSPIFSYPLNQSKDSPQNDHNP